MKYLLKGEEFCMCLLAISGIVKLNVPLPIWLYVILFISPDVGMLGYLLNAKAGAAGYNLFHHKGVALLCVAIGWFVKNECVLLAGLLLFAHSSFDRFFGYGLKYSDNFKHTHLGMLK